MSTGISKAFHDAILAEMGLRKSKIKTSLENLVLAERYIAEGRLVQAELDQSPKEQRTALYKWTVAKHAEFAKELPTVLDWLDKEMPEVPLDDRGKWDRYTTLAKTNPSAAATFKTLHLDKLTAR